jgi:hypothetical protein
MKRILLATVISIILLTMIAVPASGARVKTTSISVPGDYPTIQAAVNAASAGDTITVAAGTYNEQVVITKTLTIQGAGDSTVIKPSQATANTFALFIRNGGGKTAAIVVANSSGAVVNVKNFKVDGSLIVANQGTLKQATSMVGVLYTDSSGTLDTLKVTDVNIKNGSGILVTSVNSASPSISVEINNCYVTNYLKNGITVTGPNATVDIRNNTVNGKGPISNIAQNGIQVSYGATGSLQRNTVDGNWYTGAGWTSTGILIFESDGVFVQNNTVTGSQTGIGIEAWDWVAPSADNNKVVNNDIIGADWGITVIAYSFNGYSIGNPTANDNEIINNSITATNGNTGVYLGAYTDDGSPYIATAENNKAISNKINGYAILVGDESTASKLHANRSSAD